MMSIKARVMELLSHEETCRKGSFQKQTISASKKTRGKKISKKNINNIGYQEMKYQMMKRASCIVENYHDDVFLKTGIWKNQNYDMSSYIKEITPENQKNQYYDMSSYIKEITPENQKNQHDMTYIGYVDKDDVKDGDYNVTYVGNIDVNEEDNYDITYIGFVCNIDKISQ
jgi:hypothetical protein